eukprot:3858556-Amphidinium_carterae.2
MEALTTASSPTAKPLNLGRTVLPIVSLLQASLKTIQQLIFLRPHYAAVGAWHGSSIAQGCTRPP